MNPFALDVASQAIGLEIAPIRPSSPRQEHLGCGWVDHSSSWMVTCTNGCEDTVVDNRVAAE